MRIRFHADLNLIIVKAALRLDPGIDFQTAQTANLSGLKDNDILKLAAKEDRLQKKSGKCVEQSADCQFSEDL
jgi:hypothetical protein